MSVSRLYNKITLREHPDLSPIADASFEKGHTFIFPGDEINFITKLDAPTDIGGTLAGVTLKSVKCSMIAEKPNVFSSEFNGIFAATRSFELDSFTLAFNNSNAPMVPWGTDGYAPNINFKQDRNWQLPSGDFKRQINFFTTHTPSTAAWQWNFWFPIIFREEFWQSLAAADNDFYDPTQPQNGKNQDWRRYHNLSALPFGWTVKFKFELTYSQGGITNTIYSKLNLSNEVLAIKSYFSNNAYTNKSIKTCAVGGTPTNTPFAPIYGYQNTACFGYFTKASAWLPGEQNNLTAIFRIRPYQTGDASAWNSSSSKYALQPTDVWVNLNGDLITNDQFDIMTNDGFNIVTNDSGVFGTTITFDPANNLNIIVSAQLDYIKLAAKYPGVNKFSLYCRLYNQTTYTL